MKNLLIKETNQTPFVKCDLDGSVKIEGRSFPNNPIAFFFPIFEWAKNYKGSKMDIHIKLEYFNTSTCKQLLSLLRLFAKNHNGENVLINWYYEDDDTDILEVGQHYEMAIKAPFKFIKYNDCNERILAN